MRRCPQIPHPTKPGRSPISGLRLTCARTRQPSGGGRAGAALLNWRHVPPDLPQSRGACRRLCARAQSSFAAGGGFWVACGGGNRRRSLHDESVGIASRSSKQAAADLPARMFGAGLRRRWFIRRRFGERNGVHCPHHAAVVRHRPRRPSAARPRPRCAMRPRASARLTRSFDFTSDRGRCLRAAVQHGANQ